MQIAYVHHLNTNNIGDLMSAPYLYFKFSEWPNGKLLDILSEPDATRFDAAIYGGGAIANHLRKPSRLIAGKRIAWGVGRSVAGMLYHNAIPHEYPAGFDLLGVRDYWSEMPYGTEWVPCASCLSPLFDREYSVTREAVGFFNRRKPTPRTGLAPGDVMTNANLMDRVIPFLASAEIVVTNSYHGIYWATLLGKEVVIVDPYSSKFYDLRWPHAVAKASAWIGAITTRYRGALAEARGVNEAFYSKVQELLNGA